MGTDARTKAQPRTMPPAPWAPLLPLLLAAARAPAAAGLGQYVALGRYGAAPGGGRVRFGTPLTLSMDTKFGAKGRTLFRAYELFFNWLNYERGGILMQGERHNAELVLVDDRSDTGLARNATRRLLEDNVSLFLGPYGSTLTLPVADEVNGSGATMLAPVSLRTSNFVGRPRVFGILAPTARVLGAAFAEVARQPGAPRSVAFFTELAAPWPAVCNSVQNLAEEYNMSYLSGQSVIVGNQSSLEGAVDWLKQLQPELIVGCSFGGHKSLCEDFMMEAKRQRLNAKATIITTCVPDAGFFTALDDAARWVLGPVPWTADLPLTSESGDWSARSFAARYRSLYLEDPPYQAAATWSACSVMVEAIERANSVDPAKVAEQMQSLDYRTIFGRVQFDEHGQLAAEWKVVQIHPSMRTPKLIAPAPPAEVPLLYPTPPWDERACNRDDTRDSFWGYNASSTCGICPEVAVFNATSQSRVCQVCQASSDLWRDDSAETAYCGVLCNPGRAGRDCLPCPPGYSGRDGESCWPCEVGTFADREGSTSCGQCPRGTFAEAAGSSACSLCPAGQINGMQALDHCVDCPRGKSAGLAGMSDCILCDRGFTAAHVGQEACAPCPRGRRSTWGSQDCQPCPPFSFQPNEGKDTCIRDVVGQRSEGEGTIRPQNEEGYWMNVSSLEVERCRFPPLACLENERCREGHTGRQCLTCLPGYSRNQHSCFRCPPKLLNALMTVLMTSLAVLFLYFGARFIVGSVDSAKDMMLIVLVKQLLNHSITMSICSHVMNQVLRESMVSGEVFDWADLLSKPLSVFDGFPPSESRLWSVSCLVQLPMGEEAVSQLRDARHSEYYSPILAGARNSLRGMQQTTEFLFLFTWALWPFTVCALCFVIGLSILCKELHSRKEFYKTAYQFYREVTQEGFSHVKKKHMERRRREFIDAYFYRINDIWSPVQHFTQRQQSHSHQIVAASTGLFWHESHPIRILVMFFSYAPVCRAVLRPLICLKLGGQGKRNENVLLYQSAVSCSAMEPLTWLSACFSITFLLVFPIVTLLRLRQVQDKLHLPEMLRRWGLCTCGYRVDYWWWEAIVWLRKGILFVLEMLPLTLITMRERVTCFVAVSIICFMMQFCFSPYDDRCNGIFGRLELHQQMIFVTASLLLYFMEVQTRTEGLHATLTAIIIPSVLVILHVCHVGHIVLHLLHSLHDRVVANMKHAEAVDAPTKTLGQRVRAKLVELHRAKARDSPYVSLDHLYGWISICGSHGDAAAPPYVPKGRDASGFPNGRPQLSEAPAKPDCSADGEAAEVRAASCWQRMELQRILSLVIRHLTVVRGTGATFSLSVLDFAIRVAFLLDHRSRTDMGELSATAEEVDMRIWLDSIIKGDPVRPQEVEPGAGDVGADGGIDATPEELLYTSRGLLMEEQLQSQCAVGRKCSAQAPDVPGGPTVESNASSGEQALSQSIQEGHLTRRMRLERHYASLVYDMFSARLFRRGLSLEKLQLSLLHLQSLPREDLILWLDLFEEQWLQEKVAANRELARMAGQMKDQRVESQPGATLHRKRSQYFNPGSSPVCHEAVQAAPTLGSLSDSRTTDPSLKVASRWLYFVVQAAMTVSLTSIAEARQPAHAKRQAMEKELEALQGQRERDEARRLTIEAELVRLQSEGVAGHLQDELQPHPQGAVGDLHDEPRGKGR